jgi:peroxiredoxin
MYIQLHMMADATNEKESGMRYRVLKSRFALTLKSSRTAVITPNGRVPAMNRIESMNVCLIARMNIGSLKKICL